MTKKDFSGIISYYRTLSVSRKTKQKTDNRNQERKINMIGFVIALVVLGAGLIANSSLGLAVIGAGHFLWHWYWIFAIIKIVFLSIIGLVLVLGGTLVGLGAGLESKSKVATAVLALAGLGAGASFSALIFVKTIAKSALLLIGSYLLMTSYVVVTAQWVLPNLGIGVLLLLVGLIFMKGKKSSQVNKTTNTTQNVTVINT